MFTTGSRDSNVVTLYKRYLEDAPCQSDTNVNRSTHESIGTVGDSWIDDFMDRIWDEISIEHVEVSKDSDEQYTVYPEHWEVLVRFVATVGAKREDSGWLFEWALGELDVEKFKKCHSG